MTRGTIDDLLGIARIEVIGSSGEKLGVMTTGRRLAIPIGVSPGEALNLESGVS
jgi:hypothetical protein